MRCPITLILNGTYDDCYSIPAERSEEFADNSFSPLSRCCSVEALSEALSDWGEEEGSIVVISHDKSFCEQVGFTHVLTIQEDGTLKLEQRNTNEGDWDTSKSTLQKSSLQPNDVDGVNGAAPTVPMDEKTRKQAYNAPKRISKIESLVEQKEDKIAELEEKMMAIGNDVGKLVDLSKEKESLETDVAALMKEWEELEAILAKVEAAA
jgi:ABC transport system ATP-binding/permease protein